MSETNALRWLAARFIEKSRSLFLYMKGIGHWRPKENPELIEALFAIAADDSRHAAALADALDRAGVVPPSVSPIDYSHLHYMRPEFLLPLALKEKEASVAVYGRTEAMAYPTIAPLAIAIAADERRNLAMLREFHRKVGEAAAVKAGEKDVF